MKSNSIEVYEGGSGATLIKENVETVHGIVHVKVDGKLLIPEAEATRAQLSKAQCTRIGSTLLVAVAKHLHREPDLELAEALAKHWHPTDHEIMHAASAAGLEPTLAHLRAAFVDSAADHMSKANAAAEFDAIVAAARREAP